MEQRPPSRRSRKSDGSACAPIAGYHAIMQMKKSMPGIIASGPASNARDDGVAAAGEVARQGRITTAPTML